MHYKSSFKMLFVSPLVEVADFRCSAVEAGPVVEDGISDRSFLCFPRRGSFYSHRSGKKVFADPNHIVFFGAGERVTISYPQTEGDDSTFFSISSELVGEILRSFQPSAMDEEHPRFPRIPILSDPAVFLRHRLLLDCIDRDGGRNALAIEEMVIDLTRRSMVLATDEREAGKRDLRPATRRAHREQVDHVKNLLAKHFHEDLVLGDIARAVASSPYHLARIFKREVGVPIHRYLNRLRLRASLHYLPDWKRGLTDLALELGYSSHSHFSDAFRREFGLSPSELRQGISLKRMAELDAQSARIH